MSDLKPSELTFNAVLEQLQQLDEFEQKIFLKRLLQDLRMHRQPVNATGKLAEPEPLANQLLSA